VLECILPIKNIYIQCSLRMQRHMASPW